MAPQPGQPNAQPIIVQVLPQTLQGPARWQPIVGPETIALSREMHAAASRESIVQAAVNILVAVSLQLSLKVEKQGWL